MEQNILKTNEALLVSGNTPTLSVRETTNSGSEMEEQSKIAKLVARAGDNSAYSIIDIVRGGGIMQSVTTESNSIISPTTKDKNSKSNKKKPSRGIQCNNVFKNQETLSNSLTAIWADIINILENSNCLAHNVDVQSHTHHNLEKDEVRG